jgi:hypothetical protein
MTIYTAAQALAAVKAGTPLSGDVIVDSAADIQADLDQLQPLAAAGEIAYVNFTDATSPTITVTAAQYAADSAVINEFEGARTTNVNNATVAQTFALQSAQHISFQVTDSGQAIENNIDALSNIANEITGMTITDGTIPSFSASQMVNDSAVIGGITVAGIDAQKAVDNTASVQTIHGLEVTDSAANVSTYITGLQALASSAKLTSITLTDSGVPTVAVSPVELQADGSAIETIRTPFVLAVDGTDSNLTLTAPGGVATVLVLDGTPSQYSLTGSGDGKDFTVTETATGRSSTDHLSGFTAVQFDNGGVGSATTILVASNGELGATGISSSDVAALYSAALNRVPDVQGLNFYENAASHTGLTGAALIAQFATYFVNSAEYTSNPAHTYAQTTAGETQFITDTYNNLLHRAPSAADVSLYINNDITPAVANLTPGTAAYAAADQYAHALVLAQVSLSPEFRSDVSITAQNPASASHWLLLA